MLDEGGVAVLAETAMLLMVEGPSPGKRIFIEKTEIIIGRDERCDLVVPDRQVSRHHAHIRIEGNGYILKDLGSKNGTFVNGRELKEAHVLQDGDEIQIAYCCKLAFVAADATAPVILEVEAHGLRMDLESKRVWVAETELTPPLSLAQYRLLELLYQEPGRVYSRDEVVQAVWPEDERDGISEQAIDALARRLRERLAEVDQKTQYVITVRGHGFRLENALE
ncbi:MAG TPA: FHA domain-containing protein [Anaerolineae bacterium]|nr:FHA domain-containing protein [Anaerolineae bacterium]